MKRPEITRALRQVPIFADLDEAHLNHLAECCGVRTVAPETYLFYENEVGELLYIIVTGLVRIEQHSPLGRTKTLALLKDGECFGEMALLDQDTRSASALAVADTKLLVMGKSDFEKALREVPAIPLNIIRMLSDRLRRMNREIEDLTFRNLQGRIASQLFKLAEKFGEGSTDGEGRRISLKLTHQEIADLVGTNRESVSKAISAFRKEGSVEVDSGHIIILDPEQLRTWMK